MAAELDFRLLGPLVVRASGSLVQVPRGKLRTVLAVLLLNSGQAVSADQLAEALWGQTPPSSARVTVRTYVMRLRSALGEAGAGRIGTQPPGYLMSVDARELDVSRFEHLLASARAASRAGSWPEAAERSREALALWRGEPLADIESETLALREVPRLAELRLQALEIRAEADLHLGRHAEVAAEVNRMIAAHPLRENLHALLMLALYRSGRQADALAAYQDVRTTLVEELGAEPGAGLQELHQQILAASPALETVLAVDADLVTASRVSLASPGGAGASSPVPRQLPAGVRHFTGRQAELGLITALADDCDRAAVAGGTVVISAIDGMAGIGKTALAVHAAHLLSERFGDGQLFIDLHGYTQGRPPRSAGEALEVFLRALGVPPQQIPQDTDERAALYRQRLAATRTLILLDNAASEAQVRPLLPGAAACLVLVTSRKRLKGLYDACPLALDVLPEADAVALLHTTVGPERVPPGDPALAEIAELCGRLPLALRIAAALLRHRPAWSTRYLAGVLTGQRQRITALSDGERDLGAVFDLSYISLTDAQQHLFRNLGIVPGPDADAHAAAALTGTDPGTAARLLEDLVDHNLLIPHTPGRYRLHDLLRGYARALADRDPASDRDAALDRLIGYYRHTASRADGLVTRYPQHAPEGPEPAHAPTLTGPDSAWRWLRAERANLLACLQHATTYADDERITALTAGLTTLLVTDGPWGQAIALHATAAAAARHRRDQLSQARSLFYLGDIRALSGDHAGAARDLLEALRLYRAAGDRLGQGNALNWLGQARKLTCDYPAAARDLQEALRLYRALGDRPGQASALARLGHTRTLTCDYPAAARDLQEALRLYRALGDQPGQAYALTHLGDVRALTGDYPAAARDLHMALALCRDLGCRGTEGVALGSLGQMQVLTSDYSGAANHLEAALDLFRRIGARGNEAWALNLYAGVLAATGDHARALSLYHDALHLARETRQPDEEALALEGIGECHLHAGRTAAGITHLEHALGIFHRLAKTPDVGRLQARLAQLRACLPRHENAGGISTGL